VSRQPAVKMLPWSWHKSPGYRGQFARVERWHQRARDAKDPEDIEDYLYAFFQACHHLREWLPEADFPADRVRAFIEANVAMKVCADVANLTKHLALNRPPRTNAEPAIARVYVADGRGWFGDDGALVALTDASDRPPRPS
jgi:hypothetical protein